MIPMTVIVTMAGAGSRFKKAGYNVPKFMIEARDRTLFDWSIDSLLDYNPHVGMYVFVAQEKDNVAEFVTRRMAERGIHNVRVVQIDGLTDGQATTCMRAVPYCDPNAPVLIYNIDTYVEPGALKYTDLTGDGHIPCFHAEGNHWSFVSLDREGHATEVREKTRVSDNCSIGAYYFSSARLFADTYDKFFSDPGNTTEWERYIAPMYNQLISDGKSVTISLVDPSKVHVLGTPEELQVFLKSQRV